MPGGDGQIREIDVTVDAGDGVGVTTVVGLCWRGADSVSAGLSDVFHVAQGWCGDTFNP